MTSPAALAIERGLDLLEEVAGEAEAVNGQQAAGIEAMNRQGIVLGTRLAVLETGRCPCRQDLSLLGLLRALARERAAIDQLTLLMC